MFNECQCTTVHDLASKISTFLPTRSLEEIRNLTEFSKNRSSPAFRHAVLVDHELPRTDTHCFDVLEEAFTAMVRGSMPTQRKSNISFHKQLTADIVGKSQTEYSQRSDKHVSMSSVSVLAALDVIQANGEAGEEERNHYSVSSPPEPVSAEYDWISYVDEQHEEIDTA